MTEKSPDPVADSVIVPGDVCPSPHVIVATKLLATAPLVKSRKEPTTTGLGGWIPAVKSTVVGIGIKTEPVTLNSALIVVELPRLSLTAIDTMYVFAVA